MMSACCQCEMVFTRRSSLHRHLREVHQVPTTSKPGNLICPSCSKLFRSNEDFICHLESMHDFKSRSEKLSFRSMSEFKCWKSSVEKEEMSKFVITHSVKKNSGGGFTYYKCNRSGLYKAKVLPENRKRELKEQGSCKIDAHCPASIIVNVTPDESVQVTVQKAHFGHEKELAHLPLASPVKKVIATKLAAEMRHPEGAYSVDAWVKKESLKGADSSVLFYKPRGTCCEYPQLKDQDFMLIIMTPDQQIELQQYGEDVICMDSTHGTTAYGYLATTIMVLDSRREGFPCAFCISDRNDQLGLEIFLQKIKERVGNIHPKVLMTDMAHELYNAWVSVMSGCGKHLFCTWDVLRAWDDHIVNDIKLKEKRDDTSKILHTLLKETDPEAFHVQLQDNINSLLKDPDTHEFGKYFRSYYSGNTDKWAYCFRLYAGINVNMSLERFHGELKHVFLLGKKAKRLDITIHALIRITKRNLFQRIIANEKGQITAKIKRIRTSHRASRSLKSNVIKLSDDSWSVSSYIVTKVVENCKCDLLCKQCNVCIHNYVCTCIDCSIHFNICKHIHFLCKFLKNCSEAEENSESDGEMEPRELTLEADSAKSETVQTIASLSKQSPNQTVEKIRKKLLEQAATLINTVSSIEEGMILEKSLTSAHHTLEAMRQHSVKFKSPQKVNVRQKIEPQRKLVLKKKMKKATRAIASKPTQQEHKKIAAKAPLMTRNTFPENIIMSTSDLMQPIAMEVVIDNV